MPDSEEANFRVLDLYRCGEFKTRLQTSQPHSKQEKSVSNKFRFMSASIAIGAAVIVLVASGSFAVAQGTGRMTNQGVGPNVTNNNNAYTGTQNPAVYTGPALERRQPVPAPYTPAPQPSSNGGTNGCRSGSMNC